ncbi:MAG: hypothetical protein IPJ13_24405 [Saprospiraceae bacterium]|nr:hypothetical protein [Saprospiraceae bacterium]
MLGAGSVIHGLSGEQDIRQMGGLRHYLKSTHLVFLLGVLAIIALPPFAGFFSKDNILTAAYIKSPLLWILALISGLLTVFYMLRLYFVVFYGQERINKAVKLIFMNRQTVCSFHYIFWQLYRSLPAL